MHITQPPGLSFIFLRIYCFFFNWNGRRINAPAQTPTSKITEDGSGTGNTSALVLLAKFDAKPPDAEKVDSWPVRIIPMSPPTGAAVPELSCTNSRSNVPVVL